MAVGGGGCRRLNLAKCTLAQVTVHLHQLNTHICGLPYAYDISVTTATPNQICSRDFLSIWQHIMVKNMIDKIRQYARMGFLCPLLDPFLEWHLDTITYQILKTNDLPVPVYYCCQPKM